MADINPYWWTQNPIGQWMAQWLNQQPNAAQANTQYNTYLPAVSQGYAPSMQREMTWDPGGTGPLGYYAGAFRTPTPFGPTNPLAQPQLASWGDLYPQPFNSAGINPAYWRIPTTRQPLTAQQAAAQQAAAQQAAQQVAGQGIGGGGSSLPNWDFSQWGQNWQNPLAGVPLEYWDYALGSQERALNWQAMQDNNRWKGEEIGLSKEQLALQRQQAQQQAEQWMKEYTAAQNQWAQQHGLAVDQFDWSKNTWGKEFNRANQNDSWARQSDQWNQAMQMANSTWQQEHSKEQNRIQDQGNALAAWGRRTNPLISAM